MLDQIRRQIQSGNMAAAEALCQRVLATYPAHAEVLHLLGVIRYQAADYAAAEELISKAISADPTRAAPHFNRGLAVAAQGRAAEAQANYEQALHQDPAFTPAATELVRLLSRAGKFQQALSISERACSLDPLRAPLHLERGLILNALGRSAEASDAWERARDLDSSLAAPLTNLGVAAFSKGQFDSAEGYFRKALALSPQSAAEHANLGHVLRYRDKYDEALLHLDAATTLDSRSVPAWNNRGSLLAEMGRLDQAIACFDEVLRLSPRHPIVRYNRACLLLKKGQMPEGWQEYESRFEHPWAQAALKNLAAPLWRGEPVQGRSNLIRAEGGFGDALQFFRYVESLVQLGAHVTVDCWSPLLRIFRESTSVRVVELDSEPKGYDYHCMMMSLPQAFGTRLETIPAKVPYLSVPGPRKLCWRDRVAPHTGTKVGLVWAGGFRPQHVNAHHMDRRRSLLFAKIEPLLDIPGTRFYSLQKGSPAEQAKTAIARGALVDWTEELVDFAETAALVSNLDLVITVDTSVAHLAGALGRPVWMLSRYDGCWRWLSNRNDSPWYPTMRIFRQPSQNDWTSVVAAVGEALRLFIRAVRGHHSI